MSPVCPDAEIVLKGNLAPNGALLKVAGLKKLQHRGPARVFESEEECLVAIQARNYQVGDVVVIRNEGPHGEPDMREMLGMADRWSAGGRSSIPDKDRFCL
jgi:dihydroxy-acid dehydratase